VSLVITYLVHGTTVQTSIPSSSVVRFVKAASPKQFMHTALQKEPINLKIKCCGPKHNDPDPDPCFHLDADPDPAPYQSDANLRPLVTDTPLLYF
jgi:hypothetical protein